LGTNVLDSGFDKIRRNNCTIYINKHFRNNTFEQLLIAGVKKLRERYTLTTVPSSEFTHIYRFSVRFAGIDRAVYFKEYLHRSVLCFIKHVFRPSRARRASKATLMLVQNGFEAPTVIAVGERRFGLLPIKSYSVTFEIAGAKRIYQLIPEGATDLTKEQLRSKRELIRAFGRTIGRMHKAGIFHGDLRLGNVLGQKEQNMWRFSFLDNERTAKFRRLPGRLRVKNLVQLNMIRSDAITKTDRMRFLSEYWAQNAGGKEQKTALINKIVKKTGQRLSKKRQLSREMRRCLRENGRYLRIKTSRHIAVFDRGFCRGAEHMRFIEQIDALMDKGQILKNGNTSYVSRLSWNGKDVVVKRYNHKGFVHSLRHTMKRSRARRNWLHAHRLGVLEIATPRPLAYIEQRRGVLVWKSYLVTEHVKGQELKLFLRDNEIDDEKRATVTQQVTDLIGRLGQYHITHGDLKHSNVLITESGPVLTDLDGMKVHRWNFMYKIRKAKDLARFQNN
jgi:tRNA A-37 threonylcarbamoyl transferase component Bud32